MSTPKDQQREGSTHAQRSPHFPVVGIGASAGGLAAVQTFLENMPDNNGRAIVVVLHLSPNHKSNAAEILQRYTRMPVVRVHEKIPLQINSVYVIPPHSILLMEDGHLELTERIDGGAPVAIDLFFRTLADAHGERAFCVVLSGMGSDGAVGLTRVKEKGGVTFVQAPEDAQYDSMPRAAIATNHADIVLPVADMPQRLLNLSRNAKEIRLPQDIHEDVLPPEHKTADQSAEDALQAILKIVQLRTHHDFRNYKKATILRRLERRLQVRALPDLIAYRAYLETHADETELLLQDMLISVTNFFRDRECFDALEREAIPSIFAARRDNDPIRVWVAGCATGEEAYTIAILLREYADRNGIAVPIQIFATDIDERAIATARAGVYPGAIVADVSPLRLQSYFVHEGENYRVIKPIRESVLFAMHNILRDPPFSRLDLICCRNLLIYLDREAQRNVIETFHFALKHEGLLFLGNSETEDAAPNLFSIVDKKNRLYRSTAQPNSLRHIPPLPTHGFSHPVKNGNGDVINERRRVSFAQIHQRALECFSPPSVLIDAEYNILHLSANSAEFLEHQGGEPSHNLLSNVHPDLRLELRTALFKASQSQIDVDTVSTLMNSAQDAISVSISVHHFQDVDYPPGALLVIFTRQSSNTAPTPELITTPATELIVNHLEAEIKRYKEELQTTIERSEISTEELKASNEELQTINEELRSATEELETSKEELQSMNEELITLNSELKNKIEETDVTNDYLHNLIASTDIATIFIDREMRIVRFTPRATDIFQLIQSDQGRPLTDIRHRLHYDSMTEDAVEAFRHLRTIERRVSSNDDKHYLARVLPYRTKEDKIEGAVLTFIDVTALHLAQMAIRAGEQRLRIAAETTKDYAIITMAPDASITTWNAGAERCFGYTEAEVIGQPISIIFTPEDRANGEDKKELERALATGRSEDERWHLRKNGTKFYCSGVLSLVDNDVLEGFVKIARDMTGSKRMEVERENQLEQEKRAREQMQLASQMKDEFLAVVSHELKNPLNLIHVNAEVLSHLPEVQRLPNVVRATETIRRTVLSQAKIIDDLLDLSRANTGKLTLNLAATDIKDSIATIVQAARQNASEKNVSIELIDESTSLVVMCDSIRIEQILWNLLSNAIKFTPVGGVVTVTLSTEDNNAKLVVADSGEGIAPHYLPNVFDMFNQAGRQRTYQKGGMGIGLALVRELTQAHGGRVTVQSPGLGHGATFTVWLPLSTLHESNHVKELPYRTRLEHVRLLVVDDSSDSLESLAMLLRMAGAEVHAVTSGALALSALEQTQFDILISDIGMDEMNGYELVTHIRKRFTPTELPAIALTGYGRMSDEHSALNGGYNAHLAKPASLEDLMEVIAQLLELRGAQ